MIASLKSSLRAMWTHARRATHLRDRVNLHPSCTFTEYGATGCHTFFGYYDVTPFSPDATTLLSVRASTGGLRTSGTPLEIGRFDLSTSKPTFEPFATSTTWCWQQSCRLQWYPLTTGSKVFFNVARGSTHASCIVEPPVREPVALFDRAIYALSPDGRWGVSLNFARLQRLRPGYGYDDIPDPTANQAAPAGDGLWLVDLTKGESSLALPLAEIATHQPEASMAHAIHYFNHVLWSPTGRRFFFLHLWTEMNGTRRSRAFIWDLASGHYTLLGPRDHVSHHWWVDDEHMIIFSNERRNGGQYGVYHVQRGYIDGVGEELLRSDGHPSLSPRHARLMVTDTYPDKLGEQSVVLLDRKTNRLERAASLYSPHRFRGEGRCDLHPRWNLAGDRICVDSAHRGYRQLCVLDVNQLVYQLTSPS